MAKRFGPLALVAACALLACSGKGDSGDEHPGKITGANGSGGAQGSPPGAMNGNGAGAGAADGTGGTGAMTDPMGEPIPEFQAPGARAYVRKVKNLLTGLAPTADEIAMVEGAKDPRAALRDLITAWTSADSPTYATFRSKMTAFFVNAFQQTGFTPTEDFKPQLLENAGFDLGPLGVYGDDAFPRLVQNLQESFARTAWEIVAAGKPFTEVLTTRDLMMTTALMSLYVQIEMPNDQPFNFSFGMMQPEKLAWSVNMNGTAIPIEQTLDPSNANYMIFDDQPPMGAIGFELDPTCRGDDRTNMYTGYSQLFQRLIGFTPRYPYAAMPECWEHASLPYFTTSDLTDWRTVKLTTLGADEKHVEPYDLPALRKANELALALPRVGFYTTPAFLALWNTNDSNQHRVTANQTLLVALGESFTSESAIVPVNTVGLDPEHAVETSVCYGCHKSLDPLRQFWANEFDFNDRNDFPARPFGGNPNPRPSEKGGVLAFSDINASGANMLELGSLLAQVGDTADPPVNRFAIAFTQKLCFFADSAACSEIDPEFRRVALAFENANYDFMTLVKELLSSPLVTAAEHVDTFDTRAPLVSVARRDQLCSALSVRLGIDDICALGVAFPFSSGFGGGMGDAYAAQRAVFRLASSLPADAFSRGSENLVTPSEPTLFYRAASEMVCENVATRVVDVDGSRYSSSDVDGAIADMVATLMGYPEGDPHAEQANQILHANYQEAMGSASATDALRSTFALACQSPTSLSFGL